jgi:hypothetical protein
MTVGDDDCLRVNLPRRWLFAIYGAQRRRSLFRCARLARRDKPRAAFRQMRSSIGHILDRHPSDTIVHRGAVRRRRQMAAFAQDCVVDGRAFGVPCSTCLRSSSAGAGQAALEIGAANLPMLSSITKSGAIQTEGEINRSWGWIGSAAVVFVYGDARARAAPATGGNGIAVSSKPAGLDCCVSKGLRGFFCQILANAGLDGACRSMVALTSRHRLTPHPHESVPCGKQTLAGGPEHVATSANANRRRILRQ